MLVRFRTQALASVTATLASAIESRRIESGSGYCASLQQPRLTVVSQAHQNLFGSDRRGK
jgi:hypothetical protein